MKTMKWKFYSLAFVAGMSILTACSSDDNNDNDGNGGNGNGQSDGNGSNGYGDGGGLFDPFGLW